jgi:hypothetical protein
MDFPVAASISVRLPTGLFSVTLAPLIAPCASPPVTTEDGLGGQAAMPPGGADASGPDQSRRVNVTAVLVSTAVSCAGPEHMSVTMASSINWLPPETRSELI